MNRMTAIAAAALALAAPGLAQDSAKPKTAASRPPQVGDVAPTFTLQVLDSDKKVDLASFRGKRPVVLFFGSYT